ncbi:unnamed protein product, partial [Rotaria sp. Silwood1]
MEWGCPIWLEVQVLVFHAALMIYRNNSTHHQVDEYSRQRTEEINEAVLQSIRKVVAETQQQPQQLLADANSRTTEIQNNCKGDVQERVAKGDEEKTASFAPIRKEHGQELLADPNPRTT